MWHPSTAEAEENSGVHELPTISCILEYLLNYRICWWTLHWIKWELPSRCWVSWVSHLIVSWFSRTSGSRAAPSLWPRHSKFHEFDEPWTLEHTRNCAATSSQPPGQQNAELENSAHLFCDVLCCCPCSRCHSFYFYVCPAILQELVDRCARGSEYNSSHYRLTSPSIRYVEFVKLCVGPDGRLAWWSHN